MGMLKKEAEVVDLLYRYFPRNVVPALIGSIDVETGGTFDYKQKQKGGNGYGLFQFDYQKPYYDKWIKDNNLKDSAENQIKFVRDSFEDAGYDAQGQYKGSLDLGWKRRKELQRMWLNPVAHENIHTFVDYYEEAAKPHMDRRRKSAFEYIVPFDEF